MSGIGSIGARHVLLLAELGVRDLVVYDPQPAGLDLPAGPAQAVLARSFHELLAGGLDGVVIASPDECHLEQVREACTAGVPVLVEKPLADSIAAAAELEAVAAATGTAVLVGYVLRYSPALRRARELVAGALGPIRSAHVALGAGETVALARSRFASARPYGIVFDYSHEWDYLEWLLGPIRRVAAVGSSVADDRPSPDVVDALLELESGVGATVHLDYVQREAGRVVTVVGERATLRVDVGRGELDLRPADGRASSHEQHTEPRDAMFTGQLEHFLAVIRGKEQPRIGVAVGRRAVEVAEAVRQAGERGEWVELGPAVSGPSSPRRPSG